MYGFNISPRNSRRLRLRSHRVERQIDECDKRGVGFFKTGILAFNRLTVFSSDPRIVLAKVGFFRSIELNRKR